MAEIILMASLFYGAFGFATVFIFPIAPAIYGTKTRDTIGSVIVGMVPIILLFLDIHLENLHDLEPERFKSCYQLFWKAYHQ